ncbi:unnamed protein product [Linum tenue]|uniref:Uncharacterized protein n=1 Tax=Linum tenue TaxID=586396 RepID=A0AAV0IYF2_9ROSI|nr:unnamed protein product [Linum tenue]
MIVTPDAGDDDDGGEEESQRVAVEMKQLPTGEEDNPKADSWDLFLVAVCLVVCFGLEVVTKLLEQAGPPDLTSANKE